MDRKCAALCIVQLVHQSQSMAWERMVAIPRQVRKWRHVFLSFPMQPVIRYLIIESWDNALSIGRAVRRKSASGINAQLFPDTCSRVNSSSPARWSKYWVGLLLSLASESDWSNQAFPLRCQEKWAVRPSEQKSQEQIFPCPGSHPMYSVVDKININNSNNHNQP